MLSRMSFCLGPGFGWLIRLFWICGVVVQGSNQASAEENLSVVQYRLSFRQAESHRVEVEMSVPTEGSAQLELTMPVWTPGSYLVREYARQVEHLVALDGKTDQPLLLTKKDKNHWLVDCADTSEIVVRYTLYCHEMSVRTNWIERDFAFLTGAATYVTRADWLDHPHVVHVDALPHWPKLASSLQPIEANNPWTVRAKNFDELVDSPILIGNVDVRTFEVGGIKHHLATIGAEPFWDTAIAAKDVAKIVETEQAFWQVKPYSEYWFLNLATEASGGLEHDNSCVLMTGRWTQRQHAKYVDWLGLVSHEFFHVWNVRRLRPKVLMQYDYNQEQYMRELWVAEGITSYYDDLLLARSGLCTPKEYLERLGKNVAAVQNTPGRLHQSLVDSSLDTWIKFYRPDENANNSRISYYLKGALVGAVLDAEIRSKTNNEKSLDDVMRLLWQKHLDTGYTNDDFHQVVADVVGESMKEWLEQALSTTQELDYQTLLDWFGLEWRLKTSDKDKDSNGEKPTFGNIYVGLELLTQQGKTMVDKVTLGSPANQAGFNAGDEFIAFDGYRISTETWTERLSVYRPGDVVKCLVARRSKIVELTLKLAPEPENGWKLARVEKPSEEQEKRWRSWLAIPEPQEPAKDGQP